MKNWLTYETGLWSPIDNNGTLEWRLDGTITLDPSTIEAVVEYVSCPSACVVHFHQHCVSVNASRKTVISDIQSALP